MDNIGELMKRNGIHRIVFIPADELLPRDMFHAWRFDNTMECGRGETPEAAVADAVRLGERMAA